MNGGTDSGAPGGGHAPLANVVRGEAVRAAAETSIAPDPARLAAGWERRFVIERARAADLVAVYAQAGFEVELDAVTPAQVGDDCADCRLVLLADFVSVYTRRRAGT